MLDFAECNYKCLFKRKKKHHKAYYNASVVKNKNGHTTMETPLPPPKANFTIFSYSNCAALLLKLFTHISLLIGLVNII